MSNQYEIKKSNKVRQLKKKASYDKKIVHRILDAGLVAHVGFNQEDGPVVVPMLYGRAKNEIYLHGARKARIIRLLEDTNRISLNVTLLDGIVLARSTFNSSMHYRSVTVFGKPRLIEDHQEKLMAMKVISENTAPGRWDEVRESHINEVKMTGVIKVKIKEASAKISNGDPDDQPEDYEIPIWAGILPITMKTGELQNDKKLKRGIKSSKTLNSLQNKIF
jgi:nitroimidazol reductase NimA-like FMN-containing flavoprotein (pyridoxamine 5'-phosphate oxidase superfamily)